MEVQPRLLVLLLCKVKSTVSAYKEGLSVDALLFGFVWFLDFLLLSLSIDFGLNDIVVLDGAVYFAPELDIACVLGLDKSLERGEYVESLPLPEAVASSS